MTLDASFRKAAESGDVVLVSALANTICSAASAELPRLLEVITQIQVEFFYEPIYIYKFL